MPGEEQEHIFFFPSPPNPTIENHFSPHKPYIFARVFTTNWGNERFLGEHEWRMKIDAFRCSICLGKNLSTTLSKARKNIFCQFLTFFFTVLQLVWQNWAKLDKIGQNWANLGEIGQNWIKLDKIELSWIKFVNNSWNLGCDVSELIAEQDEDVLDTWFSSGIYPFAGVNSFLGWLVNWLVVWLANWLITRRLIYG